MRPYSCFLAPVGLPHAAPVTTTPLKTHLCQRPVVPVAGVTPRMSLSTPMPPPPSLPDPAPDRNDSSRDVWVTELQTAEDLDAAFDDAAGDTYTSVAADGTMRERPVLLLVESYSKKCR